MNTITRSVYTIGLMIYIAIMIAFFTTNIFFRNVDYFKNSILISAFLLPMIFAIGAFFSVTAYSRYKKVLSVKEAYGRAFIPMFVGGLLSVLSIFSYINFVDTPTKDLLNYQYIQSYKNSLEDEYQESKRVLRPDSPEMPELEKKYAEGKMRIAHKVSLNEDMFSIRYFGYIFAGYCVFFLFLSLFFASFFRTRISELEEISQK